MEIPAASLAGIDLRRIRDQYGSVADDLIRLDALMSSGSDSDQDFLRLIKLLLHVGERNKARELLVANCQQGEPSEEILRLEFPEFIETYEKSVHTFAQQYHCILKKSYSGALLSNSYTCAAETMQPDEQIAIILSHPAGCQLDIGWDADEFIFADLYVMADSGQAIPFRFDGQNWHVNHAFLQSMLRCESN